MFKDKTRTATYLRFFAALGLCLLFVAASPTSTSDDDGCGGDDSSSTGTIVVQNYLDVRVNVVISGPTSLTFDLSAGYQSTRTCDTGNYTVTAVVNQSSSPWHGQTVYSRSFVLSESETETCAINY